MGGFVGRLESFGRNFARSAFGFSSSTPLIMEAANLFCGVAPMGYHLTLTELRLPVFEKNHVDHAPGGAPVAIEIDTHVGRLEATFTLAGWQPEMFRLMSNSDDVFTILGLLRDRRGGAALEAQAIIQGRIGSITPGAFSRGAVQTHQYAIRNIMHYDLMIEGTQVFYWDFFERGGTVQQQDAGSLYGTLQRIFGGVFDL